MRFFLKPLTWSTKRRRAGGEIMLVVVGEQDSWVGGQSGVAYPECFKMCLFGADGVKSPPGYSAGDVSSCSLSTGA